MPFIRYTILQNKNSSKIFAKIGGVTISLKSSLLKFIITLMTIYNKTQIKTNFFFFFVKVIREASVAK